MYKFVPAEEKHINEIVHYICSTGYFEATAKNNLLGIDAKLYLRDYIVKPILAFTTVIVSPENDDLALGVITCASNKQFAELPWPKSHAHPRLKKLFEALHEFEITESYHIREIALSKTIRGQGLGKELITYAETKAKANGINNISLFAWSCQTTAIKLFLSMGMMITKTIVVSKQVPFPLLLYFEKNPKLLSMHNYFETNEYKNLNLLNEFCNEKI